MTELATESMSLEGRIEAALKPGRPMTAVELARHVRARNAEVRAALNADARFVACPTPAGRRPNGRYWTLATIGRDRYGTGFSGREAPNAAAAPSEPARRLDALWWLADPGAPRSVGEAIAAVDRRRAAEEATG